jgi:ATP-dependent DNA helicase PIF1
MNLEQRNAFESVIEHGKNVLISGPAGVGKSYILEKIVQHYRNETDKSIGVCASTGCAAVLIGAQTIHSYFGLKLDIPNSIEGFVDMLRKKRKDVYNRLTNLEILIIDEVSMINGELFDFISKVMNYIKILTGKLDIGDGGGGGEVSFGKVQVVLFGDFCQLPPISGTYCFESEAFRNLDMKICILETQVRQSGDAVFQSILLKLRVGKMSNTIFEYLNMFKNTEFGDIVPTKLFALNKQVDFINNREIEKFKSRGVEFKKYTAVSSNVKKDVSQLDIELCKGLQVIVTRNISIEGGLVNGTRGCVEQLNKDSVDIYTVGGSLENIPLFIDKIEKSDDVGGADKFKGKSKSVETTTFMPLRVAYALSIHKSQGMTIDALEIDLGKTVFEKGQAYTAISRAKSIQNVKIVNLDKDSFKIDKKVKQFYNV